jgi:hypothetical protein
MKADRIRVWLNRVSKDADRVQAVFTQIGVAEVVCSWSIEELAHCDGASLIIDALQEHCDDLGTAARYSLQQITADGRALQTKVVRAQPEDGEERVCAGQVEDPTIAGVIGQMLRHQEAMARMYFGANAGILANAQQLLKVMGEQNSELATQLKHTVARVRQAESKAAGDEAETMESVARAEAITKLTDALAQYVVPVMAARMSNGVS